MHFSLEKKIVSDFENLYYLLHLNTVTVIMKVVLKILNQSRTVQRIGGRRNANRNQTVRFFSNMQQYTES